MAKGGYRSQLLIVFEAFSIRDPPVPKDLSDLIGAEMRDEADAFKRTKPTYPIAHAVSNIFQLQGLF